MDKTKQMVHHNVTRLVNQGPDEWRTALLALGMILLADVFVLYVGAYLCYKNRLVNSADDLFFLLLLCYAMSVMGLGCFWWYRRQNPMRLIGMMVGLVLPAALLWFALALTP
ncbi:hypothetical protein [Hymenobacter sp. BT190]|uniref:hypothetical protein n=1 Tax=Hymenobacter sp. BT190 TaxID=2763505 RepID=UPI0016514D8B|nr:hypothetical protein [Hymenobacter sp. BT190]MBC6699389.1 hypothetical protein [Hymenobacter sp. BT190]